ncbi:TadE family type IV pilus minor pilin [Streptomyces sparsus]
MRVSERWKCDRGQVTAETAVVVPSLIFLLGLLMWGLLATAGQIQCVDAARAGARAAARAESTKQAVAAAEEVAPAGAQVVLRREGPLVRVRVTARSAGPGPLSVGLRAEAVARTERPTGLLADFEAADGPHPPATDGEPAAAREGGQSAPQGKATAEDEADPDGFPSGDALPDDLRTDGSPTGDSRNGSPSADEALTAQKTTARPDGGGGDSGNSVDSGGGADGAGGEGGRGKQGRVAGDGDGPGGG